MKKNNLILGFGWWRVLLCLPLLGLSACYLDERTSPRRVDYTDRSVSAHQVVLEEGSKAGRKTKSSVKDPQQEATPGPKHVAAPKLPVIQ